MPHRVQHLALQIAGLLAVIALVVAGADLLRHSRSGPTWKQRLVSAGLLLLTGLGLGALVEGRAAAAHPTLTRTTQWRTVKEAWRIITPLAAASHKSTTAQREAAARKIKAALEALAALVKAGKLERAEADLLQAEAERLQIEMLRSPPADTRVKCYKRKLLVPAADSLERIDRRLPLLEQLVAGKQLAPAVLDRVLPTLERDVQILSSPEEVQRMQDAARPQAPDAARKAKALLRKIRALMKASAKKASVKKTPADKTPAGR